MDTLCSRKKPLIVRAKCNTTVARNISKLLNDSILNCNLGNGDDYCEIRSGAIVKLKRISCGLFGITLVSTINDHPFILKIQDIAESVGEISTELELKILKMVSEISNNGTNPFFINYYSDYVNDSSKEPLKFECPKVFYTTKQMKKYKIFMIEKFEGDFNSLLEYGVFYKLDLVQQSLILAKIFMSIYSFHTFTKHYHKDTHGGNFLYVHNLPEHQSV